MVQKADGGGNGEGGPKKRTRPVKPKPAVTVQVKVIHKEGPAALLEWLEAEDRLARAILPLEVLQYPGPRVEQSKLVMGIAYGCDLTQVDGVTPELEHQLHRIGIWTKGDLLALSHRVREAVTKALVAPVVGALLEFAKED